MTKVKVAGVGDLCDGATRRVDANGRPLLLSRFEGQFFAIDAICSHAGGRLEDGDFEGRCVVCPIHSAVFDLTTGKVSPETHWATGVEAFSVTTTEDGLFVEIEDRGEKETVVDKTTPSLHSGTCPFSGSTAGIDFD